MSEKFLSVLTNKIGENFHYVWPRDESQFDIGSYNACFRSLASRLVRVFWGRILS